MYVGRSIKVYGVWVNNIPPENSSMMSKTPAEKFGLFPVEKSCSSGGENHVSSTLLQDGKQIFRFFSHIKNRKRNICVQKHARRPLWFALQFILLRKNRD